MAQAKRGRKTTTSKKIDQIVQEGEVILANEPDPVRAKKMVSVLTNVTGCLEALRETDALAHLPLPIGPDGALLEGAEFDHAHREAWALANAGKANHGFYLRIVKERLPHGEFKDWLEAQGIPKSTAADHLGIADAFLNATPTARQKLAGLSASKVTALRQLGHASMEEVLSGDNFTLVKDGSVREVKEFVKLQRQLEKAENSQRDTQAKLNEERERNKRMRAGPKKEADTRRLRLVALHHSEVISETTRELDNLTDELRSLPHDAVTKSNTASQIYYAIASGVAQLQECWDRLAEVSPPPEDGVIAPEFKLGDLDDMRLAAADARQYVQSETTRIQANRAFVGSRKK